MRSEPIGNVWDDFGVVEVVGSLIEAENKDSDGNEECEDSEDDDVEQYFSKGSSMVFSLFGWNELKESMDSARFANSALSVFEHVEIEGFVKDVKDEGTDSDFEDVVASILP